MTGSDWQIYDEQGRRKYLNEAERKRFLAAADREPLGIRALCYLLCLTGCRISEAIELKRHQLDLEMHRVTFRTLKRRKLHYRTIPIPTYLTDMLVQIECDNPERFWVMHRVTAWRHVKRLMLEADISGPVATCKAARHSFGICAASASIPGSLIQRWLGHASPLTTSIYIDAVGLEERRFAKRLWD